MMGKLMPDQKGAVLTVVLIIVVVSLAAGAAYYSQRLKNIPKAGGLSITPTAQPQPLVSSTPVVDDQQSQIMRQCGDLPPEVSQKINKQRFDIVKGALWSPDCKYIAWSKWASASGGPGIQSPAAESQSDEGVFVYIPESKQYKTIYRPKESNETPELINWESNHRLDYKTQDTTYIFDVDTDTVEKL